MSDTPRTDEAYFKKGATMYDLAGQMKLVERELNEAHAEIEEKCKDVVWLATEKAKLEDRIKRLENAGDDLHDGWRGNRNNKDKYLWAWHKAKEAKL